MAKTWRELKAEGVKRCHGIFTDGTQCRRRASAQFEFSWCDKHGPIIKAHTDFALRAIRQQQESEED